MTTQIFFYEFLIILLIHWFGDFVLQTRWQANNKSKNNKALTAHVLTYTACWVIPMFLLFWFGKFNLLGGILLSLVFSLTTSSFHWVTDYYTSRLNSKLWAKGDVYKFFVSVGFDQVLHYIQLFLTYYYLKNL